MDCELKPCTRVIVKAKWKTVKDGLGNDVDLIPVRGGMGQFAVTVLDANNQPTGEGTVIDAAIEAIKQKLARENRESVDPCDPNAGAQNREATCICQASKTEIGAYEEYDMGRVPVTIGRRKFTTTWKALRQVTVITGACVDRNGVPISFGFDPELAVTVAVDREEAITEEELERVRETFA